MKLRKQFWATLVVVVGFLALTVSAGARTSSIKAAETVTASQTNHDFIPGGISKTNANAAWSKVKSRAFSDPAMRQMLASQANVSVYNPNDWRPIGYGRASAGTGNSSVLSNGQVVPARNSSRCFVGARVLIVINKVTSARLEICTACGNPRLRQVVQQIPKRPWALGTVIKFDRRVKKSFKITCPSGQVVTGKLTVRVKGVAKARTWGKVQGAMQAKQKLSLKAAIKAQVNLKCQPMSPPPMAQPPAPALVSATATATASASASAACPDGSSASASAAASATATATGATYLEAYNAAYQLAYQQALAAAAAAAAASVTCSAAPPPSVNLPPSVAIPNQHSGVVLRTRQVCGTAADQEDQASLNVWFTAARGDILGPTTHPDAVTWCTTYRTPWSPGTDTITIHALDNHNPEVTATTPPFDIVADPNT